MKGKLIITILALSVAVTWVYYKKVTLPSSPKYISQNQLITEKPLPEHKVMPLIREINRKNSLIRNLYANMNFVIHKNFRIKLNGFVAYEKDRKFRLVCHSIVGKESDIGSNDYLFWFWSKRMSPSMLYYSSHQNAYKSRLRTPFHPIWMMESLGINQINTNNSVIASHKGYWAVFQPAISTQGEIVTRVTLLDETTQRIIGQYVYDSQGILLVSIEIVEYYNMDGVCLPKTINTIWYEEDVRIQWQLDNPQINRQIDSKYWQMPSIKPQYDLGEIDNTHCYTKNKIISVSKKVFVTEDGTVHPILFGLNETLTVEEFQKIYDERLHVKELLESESKTN